MSLINMIRGIDERFVNEEVKSFVITYKEGSGKDQTATVSGNNESDAKKRFLDSKEGRDIRVKSVVENPEEQLEEKMVSENTMWDDIDPYYLKVAAEEYLENDWDGAAMHIDREGQWDQFYDSDNTAFTISSDREAQELMDYAEERLAEESVNEENVTSNLDGGLGQPRIPHAFQRNKPTTSDKRKACSNATSSTGYGITNVKRNNYANKVDEMMNRVYRIVEGINERDIDPNIDAWVVFVTLIDRPLQSKKIAEKPSRLAAVRLYNQLVRSADFQDKYASVGMVRKDIWDEEEGQFSSESIREGKYTDFKNDDTMTPKQKINKSIAEVNRSLYEVERMISHAMKLKTEVGMDGDVFWSTTRSKFSKISERMLRIGNKLREFNK